MHCKGLSPIESLYTEKNKNKTTRNLLFQLVKKITVKEILGAKSKYGKQ